MCSKEQGFYQGQHNQKSPFDFKSVCGCGNTDPRKFVCEKEVVGYDSPVMGQVRPVFKFVGYRCANCSNVWRFDPL